MVASDLLLDELRTALAHLDDPPYLETLRVAGQIQGAAGTSGLSKGQALRRALRLAIAALDPGEVSDRSVLHGRTYEVLYRYAIGKQSVMAIGAQLGISDRQVYRELQRATEALANILSELLAEGRSAPRERKLRQWPRPGRQDCGKVASATLPHNTAGLQNGRGNKSTPFSRRARGWP